MLRLSAAAPRAMLPPFTLRAANLTTTVIEQGMSGGQIATTNEVENYPGIPLLSGAELGERFQQHAEGLGAQVAWSMVTGIDYDADAALFTVHHDMGDTLGQERHCVHGCHAAICWFCWRGYVSRSRRFVLRDVRRHVLSRQAGLCHRRRQCCLRGSSVLVRNRRQRDHRFAPRSVPCP